MATANVDRYDVYVTFDEERNVQLNGEGLSADHVLHVRNGVAVILFRLGVEDAQVVFPSYPIVWTKAGVPVSPFASFQVYRVSDKLCAVIDYNFEEVVRTYGFSVLVSDGGTIKSGDPTIINEPPGG